MAINQGTYTKLEELYVKGMMTDQQLNNAVKKGWITEEEENIIKNKKKELDKLKPLDPADVIPRD